MRIDRAVSQMDLFGKDFDLPKLRIAKQSFPLRDGITQKVVLMPSLRLSTDLCGEESAGTSSREFRKCQRNLQYQIGRACAAELLTALQAKTTLVTTDADRAPVWPTGFVGSIAHTDDVIGVVVAPATIVRALGVDLECTITQQVADEIASVCLNAKEVELGADFDMGYAAFVTLCFSMKESLFKCLFPLARVFFDFDDAEVLSVDIGRQTLKLRLLRELTADFPINSLYEGRFSFANGHVLTVVDLPAVRTI